MQVVIRIHIYLIADQVKKPTIWPTIDTCQIQRFRSLIMMQCSLYSQTLFYRISFRYYIGYILVDYSNIFYISFLELLRNHPSIVCTTYPCRVMGAGAKSNFYRAKHTHTFKPIGNLELPVNLLHMSSGLCGEVVVPRKDPCIGSGKTYKLNTERPQVQELNQQPCCWEATLFVFAVTINSAK